MLNYSIWRPIARIVLDICCLSAAFAFGEWVTLQPGQTWQQSAHTHFLYFAVFALVWCATAFDQRLFMSRRGESLTATLFAMARVYFITTLVSGFALALFLRSGYNREFFIAFLLSGLVMMSAAVLVSRPGVLALRGRYNVCRVLFVGANEHAALLGHTLMSDEYHGYLVEGFLDDDPARAAATQSDAFPWLGGLQNLEQVLVERMIDRVYVALPLGEHYGTVQRVAHLCETLGVPLHLVGDMFPLRLAACDVTSIGNVPLLSLMIKPRYLSSIQLKRAMEGAISLLLLAVSAPLLAAIAILIKLESKGPVLAVKQTPENGEGRNRLLGFRVHNLSSGRDPQTEKPQFTRIGKFLRRSGLEDLPQLFNVLPGQISYTGAPVAPAKAKPPAANGRPSQGNHSRRQLAKILLLAGLDACCVVAAYFAAIWITAPTPEIMRMSMTGNLLFPCVQLLAWYAAAIDGRLWRWRTVEPIGPCASGLLRAVGQATLVCGFLLAILIPAVSYTRRFLVAFFMLSFAALLTFRIAIRYLARVLYLLGYGIRRVVVVGANERTTQLIEALGGEARFGYQIAGLIENEAARAGAICQYGLPYLGGFAALEELIATDQVDDVYVTLPIRSHFEVIKTIVNRCEETEKTVHIVANVLPLGIARSRAILIKDIPLISLSPVPENHVWLVLKRLTDFVASSLLLVALAPLFLVVAILIKRDSPGPVFFVQDRIGQNHRRFKMIKFRSMTANAEELKKDLMHLNEADGPVFKIKNHPRITRLGALLRKYSIDELPQLFNVWLGQMSLVGPRPLMPHEVEKFQCFERPRLSVKPGMTGLWQVSGRSDIPFSEWVAMDLAYIDSWSFWKDFRILIKTFNAVVSGRGAA